jgi:hypothetical protein
MNPGQLNRRVQFFTNTSTENEFGGSSYITEPCYGVSEGADSSVTWGSLEPYRQYKQIRETADITQLDSAIVLKIRYRNGFTPNKSMLFRDISDLPTGEQPMYVIQSILPYYPGAKQSFQSNADVVYNIRKFIWIVGVKTDNSYLNLLS